MSAPGKPVSAARTTLCALWELHVDCHGTIVGCCWTTPELRRLTDKLFGGCSAFDDFELHVAVAAQCVTRNKVSLALQRDLERRFVDTLRRHAPAADREALAVLWSKAAVETDAAAAAWAVLSHPRCDDTLRTRVLQDLYLLQHQRVALQRAEAVAQAALRAEIAALKADAQRARQRQAQRQGEAMQERDALRAELAGLRGRLLAQQELIGRLREAGPAVAAPPRLDRPPRVTVPAEAVSEAAGEAGPALPASPDPAPPVRVQQAPAVAPSLAADALRATSVLCVGGRHGHVPQYRELVERHGGCFAHHDGGIEDNARRLDAQLAAADVVLCQAGCVNHNAYARVKAYCKRRGKPCVYLDKPGVGSFLRGLALLPQVAAR